VEQTKATDFGFLRHWVLNSGPPGVTYSSCCAHLPVCFTLNPRGTPEDRASSRLWTPPHEGPPRLRAPDQPCLATTRRGTVLVQSGGWRTPVIPALGRRRGGRQSGRRSETPSVKFGTRGNGLNAGSLVPRLR
jgi:hypothetical protein